MLEVSNTPTAVSEALVDVLNHVSCSSLAVLSAALSVPAAVLTIAAGPIDESPASLGRQMVALGAFLPRAA